MNFCIVEEFYRNLKPSTYVIGEDSVEEFQTEISKDSGVVGATFSIFTYDGRNFSFVRRDMFGNVPEKVAQLELF